MRGRSTAAVDTPSATVGITGSLVIHVAAVFLFFVVVPKPVIGPPVYAVELVAAPLPTTTKRVAPEAVTRPPAPAPPAEAPAPAPAPAKPTKAEAVKPKAKAEPAPTPTKPVQTPEQPVEKTPVTRSETQPLPGETPSTGTDVANIKIPGIDFPYPEYLRNIMNEVLRRWNAPNNRLRAEVAFLILKDGSVRDIRFLKRSGNFSFDLEAQGAIEAAGNGKAFGALPDGWDANVLPVTFVFEPRQ
jgi:outer membrane biosynthesis protein TonB